MSPKVVIVTPGWRAISMAVSMSRLAVTHTGQPGPEISVTFLGITSRSPFRAMATVWVPHTSMIFMGTVAASLIFSMSRRASSGSRYTAPDNAATLRDTRFAPLDELDQLEGLVRELLVDDLDGEAGVHEHPVAFLGVGHQVEADVALHAHDVDVGHAVLTDGDDLAGDRETHIGCLQLSQPQTLRAVRLVIPHRAVRSL